MALQPLDRPPLVSRSVQEAIRDFVIEEGLQPGDALPAESELARQLGVSRNSVREAVKALESLGLLEARRGSGLYVSDFSLEPLLEVLPYAMLSGVQDLADVFQIRRVLEMGFVDKAMQVMPPETLAALLSVVERMRISADHEQPFAVEDREFHRLLFMHLNNRALMTVLDAYWLVFRKAANIANIKDNNPMGTYCDHFDIVVAIEANDVAAAKDALAKHYDGLLGRLRRVQREMKDSQS